MLKKINQFYQHSFLNETGVNLGYGGIIAAMDNKGDYHNTPKEPKTKLPLEVECLSDVVNDKLTVKIPHICKENVDSKYLFNKDKIIFI